MLYFVIVSFPALYECPRCVVPCSCILQCIYALIRFVYDDCGFQFCSLQILFFKDYINFSLARHSFNLKRLVEAKEAFEKLFVHKSSQLTVQQETNIKEYIFIHKVSAYGIYG